jgi:hypothetical protein
MRATGLEVADIFRQVGPAYRQDHADAISGGQRRVMRAIERCRTAALGGHVEQCDACGHQRIVFNSCIMGRLPIRGVRMNAPTLREVRSAVFAQISSP